MEEFVHSHENIEKVINMNRDKENFKSNGKTDFSTNAYTNRTNDNEFNLISFSNQKNTVTKKEHELIYNQLELINEN